MNHKEIISQIQQLDSGIIPFFVWLERENFSINKNRWDQIPPDEIRKKKRKFRKLYRQACKKYNLDPKHGSASFKRKIVKRYLLEREI